MLNFRFFVSTVTVFLLASCATSPAPQPSYDGSSGVGISVSIENRLNPWDDDRPVSLEDIYFVKLNENGDPLGIDVEAVIPSSYSKDGILYLLDVKPGRYAAVAGYFVQHNLGSAGCSVRTTSVYSGIYFDEELIKATEVTVAPGQLVFMGNIVLNVTPFRSTKPDKAQGHYMKSLEWLSSQLNARLEVIARDKADEKTFLETAGRQFEGSGWADVASSRLQSLNADKADANPGGATGQ